MNTNYICAPMSRNQYESIFLAELRPLANALYGFCFNLCKNQEDTNDLVQETMLKAWRNIEKYESGTNAKAWLFTIAKHLFINEYRKGKRQPIKVNIEDIARVQDTSSSGAMMRSDLHDEVFQDSFDDEVYLAFQKISVNAREIMLLDLEDFSYEEMAKILKIEVGTVRSRLSRSRATLAKLLSKYGDSLGYKITKV